MLAQVIRNDFGIHPLVKKTAFAVLFFLVCFSPTLAQSSDLSYLALGDSYTIGEKVPKDQRWPVQLVKEIKNQGFNVEDPKIIAVTGWTTIDLKQGLSDACLNPPYDMVSLLIGVNDQYQGLDIHSYPEHFRFLLQKAIALAGDKPDHVFVLSIPDYSVTPYGQQKNPQKISREIEKYNSINKAISDSINAHYINITPISTKAADNPSLMAYDGLHPSGKMYALWVDKALPILLPKIQKWAGFQ